MIYVYLNDTEHLLFEAGSNTLPAESAILTEADGNAPVFECTIYNNNANYDTIALKDLIIIENGSNNIFTGFVTEIERSVFGAKKITAIGAETLLERVMLPSYKKNSEDAANTYFNTFSGFVTESLGTDLIITYSFDNAFNLAPFEYKFTDALSVLKMVSEMNNLRFYAEQRFDGTHIIIEKRNPITIGELSFGHNIIDYTDNFSLDSIITSVIPVGAVIGTYADGMERRFVGKVPMDQFQYPFLPSEIDLLRVEYPDDPLIAQYGRKTAVVYFDAIDNSHLLLTKYGFKWLDENKFAKLKINVSAADISRMTGNDLNSHYEVGNYMNVICSPLGINTSLILQRQTFDILHPEKTALSLSGSREYTYTEQIGRQIGGLYNG